MSADSGPRPTKTDVAVQDSAESASAMNTEPSTSATNVTAHRTGTATEALIARLPEDMRPISARTAFARFKARGTLPVCPIQLLDEKTLANLMKKENFRSAGVYFGLEQKYVVPVTRTDLSIGDLTAAVVEGGNSFAGVLVGVELIGKDLWIIIATGQPVDPSCRRMRILYEGVAGPPMFDHTNCSVLDANRQRIQEEYDVKPADSTRITGNGKVVHIDYLKNTLYIETIDPSARCKYVTARPDQVLCLRATEKRVRSADSKYLTQLQRFGQLSISAVTKITSSVDEQLRLDELVNRKRSKAQILEDKELEQPTHTAVGCTVAFLKHSALAKTEPISKVASSYTTKVLMRVAEKVPLMLTLLNDTVVRSDPVLVQLLEKSGVRQDLENTQASKALNSPPASSVPEQLSTATESNAPTPTKDEPRASAGSSSATKQASRAGVGLDSTKNTEGSSASVTPSTVRLSAAGFSESYTTISTTADRRSSIVMTTTKDPLTTGTGVDVQGDGLSDMERALLRATDGMGTCENVTQVSETMEHSSPQKLQPSERTAQTPPFAQSDQPTSGVPPPVMRRERDEEDHMSFSPSFYRDLDPPPIGKRRVSSTFSDDDDCLAADITDRDPLITPPPLLPKKDPSVQIGEDDHRTPMERFMDKNAPSNLHIDVRQALKNVSQGNAGGPHSLGNKTQAEPKKRKVETGFVIRKEPKHSQIKKYFDAFPYNLFMRCVDPKLEVGELFFVGGDKTIPNIHQLISIARDDLTGQYYVWLKRFVDGVDAYTEAEELVPTIYTIDQVTFLDDHSKRVFCGDTAIYSTILKAEGLEVIVMGVFLQKAIVAVVLEPDNCAFLSVETSNLTLKQCGPTVISQQKIPYLFDARFCSTTMQLVKDLEKKNN